MRFPVVLERTNVVYVTNATTGKCRATWLREPVATNLVMAMMTNFVPVVLYERGAGAGDQLGHQA